MSSTWIHALGRSGFENDKKRGGFDDYLLKLPHPNLLRIYWSGMLLRTIDEGTLLFLGGLRFTAFLRSILGNY